jgi:hypothetical protein
MRQRMLRWALAGICIAVGWTAYAFATTPDYEIPLSETERLLQAIAYITCPALLTGATFHWVIPLNGVIYAIVGFAVAFVRTEATSDFETDPLPIIGFTKIKLRHYPIAPWTVDRGR